LSTINGHTLTQFGKCLVRSSQKG